MSIIMLLILLLLAACFVLILALSILCWLLFYLLESRGTRNFCQRLGVLLLVGACAYGSYVGLQRVYLKSLVPDEIHISSIEYAYQDYPGIGLPSDEEQALLIFNLEPSQAQQIQQQGPPHLSYKSASRAWQAIPWPDAAKFYRSKTDKTQIPITSLINSYDAGTDEYRVELDAAQAHAVQRILYSPGSYYTYSRQTLLVLSPQEQKLLYIVFR